MPGCIRFAGFEKLLARLKHFLRAPLTLGDGAAGPVDVGTRSRVRPIQKQHARPDVNGVFEMAVEIQVKALNEQLVGPAGPIDSSILTFPMRSELNASRFGH